MTSKPDSLKDFKNQIATILNKLTNLAVPEQHEAIKFMRNTLASVEVDKLIDSPQEATCAGSNFRITQLPTKRNRGLSPKSKLKIPEGGPRLSARSALKRTVSRISFYNRTFDDTSTVPQEKCDTSKMRSAERNKNRIHRERSHCRDKVRKSTLKKRKIAPNSGKVNSLKKLCVLCRKINPNFSSLLQHLFDHQGSSKSCICCKKSFNNAIGFEYHKVMKVCDRNLPLEMVTQVNNPPVDSSTLKRIIVCPFCSARFSKYFNLRRHLSRKCSMETNLKEKVISEPVVIRTELGKFEKELNPSNFTTLTSDTADILKLRKEVHTFLCEKCNKSFHTTAMLKLHKELHKEWTDASHTCSVCQCSFFTRKKLRLHIKGHSTDEKKKSIKGSGDEPKKKPVKCDKCEVYFSNNFSYQRHYKRVHSSVAESCVVCEKCGKKFNGDIPLQNHNRIFHKEMLSCNECDYKTPNRNNLKRHIQLLHGVVTKKFPCEKCSAEFKLLTTYRDHMMTVHNEERAYTCYICTATFKIHPQLKRHMMVHKVATLSCPHCPMMFKRTDHRDRHITGRHKKLLTKNVVKSKRRKTMKAELNQTPNDDVNMPMDQVFSLIDVQSGELVTLSVTEMSRNAVLNMSGGELLNADNIPVLWNNLDDAYALEPLLPTVTPSGHYPHAQTDTSGYPYIPSGHNLNDHMLKSQSSALVSNSSGVQHLSLNARPMSGLNDIVLVDGKNMITSPILNPVTVMVSDHVPIDQSITFIHENK